MLCSCLLCHVERITLVQLVLECRLWTVNVLWPPAQTQNMKRLHYASPFICPLSPLTSQQREQPGTIPLLTISPCTVIWQKCLSYGAAYTIVNVYVNVTVNGLVDFWYTINVNFSCNVYSNVNVNGNINANPTTMPMSIPMSMSISLAFSWTNKNITD